MQTQETKAKRIWNDLETHRRDSRGNIIEVKHYRMHIQGGTRAFEVPPNSGNLFYEQDGYFSKPAGRLVDGKIKLDEPHVEYVAPLSASEQEARETEAVRAKNQTLEAELAALRAERDALEKKLTQSQSRGK